MMHQAVMITMEGREDSALKTAEGLSEAGVTTEIFVQPFDWPVGGAGNNRNSRRALAWAMEKENLSQPGVLFVEDDIIIKPERFMRAVDAAYELGEVMYFYMHDINPRIENCYQPEAWIQRMAGPATRRGKPWSGDMSDVIVEEGPRKLRLNCRMFGAQCFYLPKHYIRFLYEHMDQSYQYASKIKSSTISAIDTSLNNWRAANSLPSYCYLPHPVQHLQNRTRREGRRIDTYSRSFDLTSHLEVPGGV